ncbi:ATP-binding protein [Caloramator mitchellensis]|nr:ATP-binding protein [Caloramator mitchellensis]
MFVGRNEELNFLNEKYNLKSGQFIVLYGRRRIGKTELLRHFSKDKPHIFYVCRETVDSEQLKLFSKKLLEKSSVSQYLSTFKDWEDAFRFFKDLPYDGKKLVIIDEFPYMVNSNKSIPSILQNLWDETLKDENLMIVLCGSSMSFIEKEILAEKNPLFGRTTGVLKLDELDFYTASLFFENKTIEERIILYSILGGIPHYLKQFDYGLSIELNIKKNILTKGSVLYSEVDFLMKQELRETATYYTIIQAIAMGNTKLNDIHTKTGIDKTKILVYLKNLMDLNLIEREYPITMSIKKTSNSQNGLYKLKDNYFKFYYRFVFPNISELEEYDIDGVYELAIKPFLNEYVSFAFEDVCKEYLRKNNKQNKLPFRFLKIGRWWDKKDEIDIVAYDNLGNALFGECKWKNSKAGLKELNKLKEKSIKVDNNFINKYYYIFSKSGFDDELLDIAKIDNTIKLIDLNKIFD